MAERPLSVAQLRLLTLTMRRPQQCPRNDRTAVALVARGLAEWKRKATAYGGWVDELHPTQAGIAKAEGRADG